MDKRTINNYLYAFKQMDAFWGTVVNHDNKIELKATNNSDLFVAVCNSNDNDDWKISFYKDAVKIIRLGVQNINQFTNKNGNLYFNGIKMVTITDAPEVILSNKGTLIASISPVEFKQAMKNIIKMKPDDKLFTQGALIKQKDNKIEIVATNTYTLVVYGDHIENEGVFLTLNILKIINKTLQKDNVKIFDFGEYYKIVYGNYYIITQKYDIKYPPYETVTNYKKSFEFYLNSKIIKLLSQYKDVATIYLNDNTATITAGDIIIKEVIANNIKAKIITTPKSFEFFKIALQNKIECFEVSKKNVISAHKEKLHIYNALMEVEK